MDKIKEFSINVKNIPYKEVYDYHDYEKYKKQIPLDSTPKEYEKMCILLAEHLKL